MGSLEQTLALPFFGSYLVAQFCKMKLCVSFLLISDSIPRKPPKNSPTCAPISDMFKNAHCKCSPEWWWEGEKQISSICVTEYYAAVKANELRLCVSLRISTCTCSAALNSIDHSFLQTLPSPALSLGSHTLLVLLLPPWSLLARVSCWVP